MADRTTEYSQLSVDPAQGGEKEVAITVLPTESVLQVLSYLSPSQLAVVSRLSSTFTVLARDDYLWKPLCLRWGIDNEAEKDWKGCFRRTIAEQIRAEKQASKECWKPTTYARKTWRNFTQGGYAVVNKRPCKIVNLLVSRPGKHGHSKTHITAEDLFTGARFQQVFAFGTDAQVPEVQQSEYELLDIYEDKAQLLPVDAQDEEARTSSAFPLPQGDLGDQLRDLWQRQAQVKVTVLSAQWDSGTCHEEGIVAVKRL